MIIQIQPWIDEEELKEVISAVKSTWITEHDKTEEFTIGLKKVTKAKYLFCVDHGTSALIISLLALGVGRGDEVIVPDITFGATLNSVLFAGASPVLVDVDPVNFIHIDINKIEEKITKKTKAIMPVHLYGYSVEMDGLLKIAKKHNIAIVEDAAQGIGVKYKGRQVGTIGDTGIFSFYGNKTVTTGEGGAFMTNNKKLYENALSFSHEGREKGSWIQKDVGYNFCFTDVQAAIGVAQLRKLKTIIANKRKIFGKYKSLLSSVKGIKFIPEDKNTYSTYWMTTIFVDDADKLSKYLLNNGVQTRRTFYPLHMQPSYKKLNLGKNYKISEECYRRGLSLPSSANLPLSDVETVCRLIQRYFKGVSPKCG